MQSKFGSQGLPLCLSSFTLSHPSLSTEIADHDRRRETMRRQRSSASAPERADREIGFTRNMEERLFEGIGEGDLVDDLFEANFGCVAKAA